MGSGVFLFPLTNFLKFAPSKREALNPYSFLNVAYIRTQRQIKQIMATSGSNIANSPILIFRTFKKRRGVKPLKAYEFKI